MASVQQLKSRIKSVDSTRQITKAMQLVSAAKMRRAIAAEKETLDYATAAREILRDLARDVEAANFPLFQQRKVRKKLIILIASDQGLAGAYNANILKKFLTEIKRNRENGVTSEVIAVGRKASNFAARLKDISLLASYEKLPDELRGAELHAIFSQALEYFLAEKCDEVQLIFTRFYSSMKQEVLARTVLPAGADQKKELGEISRKSTDTNDDHDDFAKDSATMSSSKFEPSRGAVLEAVAARLVESEMVQALLDSRASEHSMRMLAMKNATDNATSISDDLTLEMNKERQAKITQELNEISAGAEAVK